MKEKNKKQNKKEQQNEIENETDAEDENEEEQDEIKKVAKIRLFLCVLAVLILVLLVIGVTYGVYSYTDKGVHENVIRTGSIEFKYNETTNGIYITDAIPMSDEEGKVIPESGNTGGNITRGYFDFNVSAHIVESQKISYEIYGVDTTKESSKLEPQYVKVYLTEVSGQNETAVSGFGDSSVPTYSQLETSVNDKSGKRLYSGSFTASGTRYFRLRLWVSKNYPILEKGGNETFSMRVNVGVTAL